MIYYFGKLNVPGHFLYAAGGRSVSYEDAKALPFRYELLDGGLLPQCDEIQGRQHLSIINGWTIVSMWDRSGDSRGRSNSSFLADGIMTREELMTMARHTFPDIVARIENFK
jgi:hypothetical protein